MSMQTMIQRLPEETVRERRRGRYNNNNNNHYEAEGFHPRSVRLDFPRFDGEDPARWLYKAHQSFSYYNTQPNQKLMLAAYHMEGKALIWFQDLEDFGTLVDWGGFTMALLLRFGNHPYDDPMEALTRLKQTSSVEVYKSQFEALSN